MLECGAVSLRNLFKELLGRAFSLVLAVRIGFQYSISKHPVQLLPYPRRISAICSPASHYKCKSVTFTGFSLRHFRFVYVRSVRVFCILYHNEPQLLIASK